MYLQDIDSIFEIEWAKGIKYGEIHKQDEIEFSRFNFDESNVELLLSQFDSYEKEAKRLNKAGLITPSYEYCLKCSHTFNLLDARGVISVTERTKYIARVRALAKLCAEAFSKQREDMGYPLLPKQDNTR